MRWSIYLFVLALLSLVVTGCTTPAEEIPFTVIAEGDTAANYPNRQGVVIASPSEWETLWEQLHRYTIPRPALPEVDFTQHTLLAVFAGEKPSGGYTIRVKRVIQTDQRVIVHVIETAPGTGNITTALITYPYQIVKVRRISLPVHFDFYSYS
jgi:hypothetical protein